MKQEFITSKGKVVIERDTLFIKIFKFNFTETLLYIFGLPIVFITLLIFILLYAESGYDYFKVIIYLFIFSNHLKEFYINLFKKSFSNRIALNRINSIEIKPHIDGLEQEIILHLKNGRYRSILFRNLENQYQPFIEAVSSSASQPQLAI